MRTEAYTGQFLWVDLSAGTIEARPVRREDLEQFIGGRGLGIRLLSQLAPKGVDPLSPKNPLIISTGPYTGAGVFSAFFNVTTKAPLTGIAASSHCGGFWGPSLRKAGFTGIVVTGAASSPCYLSIDNGQAVLKPADHLWGKGTFETQGVLETEAPGAQILSIGQAGENRVRYAAMMNHQRAAGRSGVGAVMGSKQLKAIVVQGNQAVTLADPDAVRSISANGAKQSMRDAAPFAKYGSSIAFEVFNNANTLPTRNFRAGHFYESEHINGDALKNNYFVKDRGCSQCPLRCGNVHTIKEGDYRLEEVEGPEYETMMAFGSNCGNANVESILMANYLCNDLGLDTISCGDTIALLMDLFDLGIVSKNDLDGQSLNWGDHKTMISLIPKIVSGEGIGKLMAEGSYRLARHFGSEALERVIHAKKQEYPGYGSRRSFGTGVSLVTSNRGACHLRATVYVNEIFNGEFEDEGFEAGIGTLLEKEHLMAVADAFLVCKFGLRSAQYTWPVLTELINALTGSAMTEEDLKLAGERIWNLERLYNIREGVEEDMPPPRFFTEDLDDGMDGGEAIDRERFIAARALYYKTRGWDEHGVPTPEKRRQLGLAG